MIAHTHVTVPEGFHLEAAGPELLADGSPRFVRLVADALDPAEQSSPLRAIAWRDVPSPFIGAPPMPSELLARFLFNLAHEVPIGAFRASIDFAYDGDRPIEGVFAQWARGLAEALAYQGETHPPIDTPPSTDTRAILAAIGEVQNTMSKTSDALADLSAADAELKAEVDAAVAKLAALPQAIAEAVSNALADAGVSDADNATAGEAAVTATKGLTAEIDAAINPAPPPPPPPAPSFAPTSISGTVGVALTGSFSATGLTGPVTYSAADVPPDWSIAGDGTISGTPSSAATGDIVLTATDSATPPVVVTTTVAYSIAAPSA